MERKTVFVLGMILIAQVATSQPIERIEPPHWWTGMKDQTLQIMLYGNGVGSLKPTIKYKGLKMISYTSPENPNYLFIDLSISRKCRPGSIPIKLSDSNKEINLDYSLHERVKGSAMRQGFNSSDVIYLITPDRFANGEPGNDNIPGMEDKADRKEDFGRHGGDIEGMRQHLDYISSTGFTCVWPNPLLENNMPKHSYHGYAITDFYKVDPRMGSNESYKNFCKEASEHGIKVIKDMVVNHCGASHWWMKDPPTKDWINHYKTAYVQTNHRKTTPSDPYVAHQDEDIMTKGWFVQTMPDLNTTNPFLGKYLIQNSIWWIEYAGLSGIRMDTYLYPDESYMSDWSEHIMTEYPNFNIAGEIWYDNPAIVSYWQKNKINQNGYVSFLPSLFDFPIQSALSRSLKTKDSWEDGWIGLYEMLAQDFQYADAQNMVVFADNHDMSRIYTQADENYSKYKLALAYILTIRGIPQIYYGTEILMSNKGTESHGVIRSDFPGGWSGDKIDAFKSVGLSAKQQEARSFLNKILEWRKKADVIHNGKTMHFVPQDGVYIFFRYNDEKRVMVILNKNEIPVTIQLDRFQSLLASTSKKGIDILTGQEVQLETQLNLIHSGPMIIELFD